MALRRPSLKVCMRGRSLALLLAAVGRRRFVECHQTVAVLQSTLENQFRHITPQRRRDGSQDFPLDVVRLFNHPFANAADHLRNAQTRIVRHLFISQARALALPVWSEQWNGLEKQVLSGSESPGIADAGIRLQEDLAKVGDPKETELMSRLKKTMGLYEGRIAARRQARELFALASGKAKLDPEGAMASIAAAKELLKALEPGDASEMAKWEEIETSARASLAAKLATAKHRKEPENLNACVVAAVSVGRGIERGISKKEYANLAGALFIASDDFKDTSTADAKEMQKRVVELRRNCARANTLHSSEWEEKKGAQALTAAHQSAVDFLVAYRLRFGWTKTKDNSLENEDAFKLSASTKAANKVAPPAPQTQTREAEAPSRPARPSKVRCPRCGGFGNVKTGRKILERGPSVNYEREEVGQCPQCYGSGWVTPRQ